MTVNRSFVAAVALIAAIAMSAVGANAAPAARTAASPFELTLDYRTEAPWWEFHPAHPHEGTFAARGPFCRSGTVAPEVVGQLGGRHRLTCDDGSGSLVVSFAEAPWGWLPDLGITSSWKALDGTGSYVGLRGKGSVRSEILGWDVPDVWDPNQEVGIPVTWRYALEGVAAEDAIAPTIGFSSVEVTKLRRPAGAYSLTLAIAFRDDVEGSPVSYEVRVTPTTSARELAGNVGTAQAGTVSMTMRVDYYKPRVRAVLVHLTASDEVGNESSVSQVVKLPR